MKCAAVHSHKDGLRVARELGLGSLAERVVHAPGLRVDAGSTKAVRAHVRRVLAAEGWPGEATFRAGYDLKVFSLGDRAAWQVQTGNAARAHYDLLKLQYLYTIERVELAFLVVPTRAAAAQLGSNVAAFERVRGELALFARVLSLPLVLVGFE